MSKLEWFFFLLPFIFAIVCVILWEIGIVDVHGVFRGIKY